MTQPKTQTLNIQGKEVILETGLFAAQASGAVTVRCGDTVVFAVAVRGDVDPELDYFPLQVEYREKHYAGGIISSSRFVKREGRPSDNEILTSRLIDRSIRPLFPSGYFNAVQVIVHPLSIDGVNEPEILGVIAASAALSISDIPFAGPVGALRIGLDSEGKYLVNPTNDEKKNSPLDLVISADKNSIVMVEAGASEVTEDQVLGALKFGQEAISDLIDQINTFAKGLAKDKQPVPEVVYDPQLVKLVEDKVNVEKILADARALAGEGVKLAPVVDALILEDPNLDQAQLLKLADKKVKNYVRNLVLEKDIRYDGRKIDEIRPISAQVGLLPRTHGSGFFMRGMTHALSIVTLGSPGDEQTIDGMKGEETKRYMHHYNMPAFANGEPGRFGFSNRREIGHGALAERALLPVIPSQEAFPYTIRVVSEIMSSNGSTSQASVCGSTLALMDAGVPIVKPVAGIAMGLVTDGKKFVTLSDIAGLEDFTGDMDFKVAGTKDGITAIQMDVKTLSVTAQLLESALKQAKIGRLFILDKMLEAIKEPRPEISKYAPRIATVNINHEKIGTLIGPGGKMIRQIQTDYTVTIDVTEEGVVSITGIDPEKVEAAKNFVSGLTAEAEVGKVYTGTVKRLMPFGAFVEILPGQEGLVHVSRMGEGFVADPAAVVKEGDEVQVRVYEVDDQGRINLTMMLDDTIEASKSKGQRREGGGGSRPGGFGGDRGPRRDFGPRSGGDRGPRRAGPPRESRFSKFQDHR